MNDEPRTTPALESRVSRRQALRTMSAVGIASLGAGTLLDACSSGGSSGQITKGTTAQSHSGAPRKQLSGHIVVAIANDVDPKMQKALDDAYQQHQPGVTITWQKPPSNATGGYPTWLGTQLASGNIQPDIVSGNYQKTYAKYVNFDEWLPTTNPYTKHPWGQDITLVEAPYTAGQVLLGTRRVGTLWYYNKTLFKRAGATPPSTWAQWITACERLHKAGITPISMPWTIFYGWQLYVYFDQYHIDWVKTVRAHRGDWDYDPALDGKFVFNPNLQNLHNTYTFNTQRFFQGIQNKTLRFDTPQVADMLTNLLEIFPKYVTKDFYVLTDPHPPFLKQDAAMMYSTTGDLLALPGDLAGKNGKPRFEWGYFEPPPMTGKLIESRVTRGVGAAGGEFISVIDKSPQQTDLVMDFVMFWASNVGFTPFLDASYKVKGFAPSGPPLISGVQDPPKIQKVWDRIPPRGNAQGVQYNGVLRGSFAPDNDATDLVLLLQHLFEGKQSPQAYAKSLQDYVYGHLDDYLTNNHLTKADIANPARRP